MFVSPNGRGFRKLVLAQEAVETQQGLISTVTRREPEMRRKPLPEPPDETALGRDELIAMLPTGTSLIMTRILEQEVRYPLVVLKATSFAIIMASVDPKYGRQTVWFHGEDVYLRNAVADTVAIIRGPRQYKAVEKRIEFAFTEKPNEDVDWSLLDMLEEEPGEKLAGEPHTPLKWEKVSKAKLLRQLQPGRKVNLVFNGKGKQNEPRTVVKATDRKVAFRKAEGKVLTYMDFSTGDELFLHQNGFSLVSERVELTYQFVD